jgi:hypothetical protein
MRISLSDPSRLVELRDFYSRAQARAVVDGDALDVELVGGRDPSRDRRQLANYLDTWLKIYGAGVTAIVDGCSDVAGEPPATGR